MRFPHYLIQTTPRNSRSRSGIVRHKELLVLEAAHCALRCEVYGWPFCQSSRLRKKDFQASNKTGKVSAQRQVGNTDLLFDCQKTPHAPGPTSSVDRQSRSRSQSSVMQDKYQKQELASRFRVFGKSSFFMTFSGVWHEYKACKCKWRRRYSRMQFPNIRI